MTLSRRDFLKQTGLTLTFTVAGAKVLLTPAQAYEQTIPFQILRPDEVSILEAVTEIFLPGARQAGVAHFVDQQLSINPDDSLLMLKYFNYPPPYADFYRTCLQQINKLSQALYKKEIIKLNEANGRKLIETIRDGNPGGWQGPPAPLAYHAFRNDAVDVVYGTVEGFKKLGIPYMEHILPPEGWS